jgi:hypothetical protein
MTERLDNNQHLTIFKDHKTNLKPAVVRAGSSNTESAGETAPVPDSLHDYYVFTTAQKTDIVLRSAAACFSSNCTRRYTWQPRVRSPRTPYLTCSSQPGIDDTWCDTPNDITPQSR